ncbi:MAG: hypothetical protein B6I22_06265 [Desulfobacteraceae bacterium 4572_123]|nr:MAG: hypothetical protein B6I22_06265 [Desulfobacteraceae bacterium 4572_123]
MKKPKGCFLIILIFFAFIVLIGLIGAWNNYKNAKASESWPSTNGFIISSMVKTDLGKSDDDEPKYKASITYKYTIDGIEYTGERISFSAGTFLKKGKADSLVFRYPKGKKVKVYYDPEKLHDAVLERGRSSSMNFPIVIGIFVIFICLIPILRVLRKKKKTNVYQQPGTISTDSTPAIGTDAKGYSSVPVTPSKAKSRKPPILLSIAFLAGGIFLIAWGANELKGAYQSKSWPSTQGKITSSYIKKQVNRDSSNRTTTSFSAMVHYRYMVGGTTYPGDRICFGGTYSGSKRSLAKKVADSYPKGKKVTVYYDPENPKGAVLKTGFRWTTFVAFILGLIFLCVGIACYISYCGGREDSLHNKMVS